MKKLLLSVMLCASMFVSVSPMKEDHNEQETDLIFILQNCSNEIVVWLDGSSFSSLAQVCTEIESICLAMPAKYFGFSFCDAVMYGSEKYIHRFFDRTDEWMFLPEAEEIFALKENDVNNPVKVIKYSFSQGLQDFFQNCSICSVCQGDKILRYCFTWKDSPAQYHNVIVTFYLNIEQNNQATNKASEDFFESINSHELPSITLQAQGEFGCTRFGCNEQVNIGGFIINMHAHSCWLQTLQAGPLENPFKSFVLSAMFLFAIQKNRITLMYAMLNNPGVYVLLPLCVLEIAKAILGTFSSGCEITAVLDAKLSERRKI